MAKKSLKVKQTRAKKYKTQENTPRRAFTDAKFVEDHVHILENMEFAVFVLEN